MFVSKSDYNDIIDFLKLTELELYNRILKIQKYTTKKSITSRLIYTQDDNDHYVVDFYMDTITFYKTGKFFVKVGPSIFEAKIDDKNIIVNIPYNKICFNSYIWKCYQIPNKNPYYKYTGHIGYLMEYFGMNTVFHIFTNDPIIEYFISIINDTDYYITDIISLCKENNITEPTEENLFYLKLLLS